MASISDAEFERLQNQLLEIKTINYTLEEKLRKQSVETLSWKEKCDRQEKDLSKYQNLAKLNPLSFAKTFQLNKGQKEKELIDSLNEEKELYQKKLENQEKEFKLSNEMLRSEIKNLMDEIKKLKNQKVPLNSIENDNQSDNSSVRCSSFSNDSDGEITLQLTPNSQRKTKITYSLLSDKEQLENSLDETTKNLNILKDENQNLNNKLNELKDRNLKIEQECKNLKELNCNYLDELKKLKDENEFNKKEMINFKELADKRLSTIDELKEFIEDTSGKAELEIEAANKKVNEIKLSLNKELSLLKTEKKDLMIKNDDLNNQLELNKNKLNDLEIQFNKLNNENKEIKIKLDELNSINEENESNKKLIEKLEDEKQQTILQMHDENELKLKELNEQNESLKEQLIQKDILIKKLKQDIEDQIEDRKIHEKKGVMIVRELKKQLNNEKKMKERLQEKFGELQGSEKSFEIGSKSFDTTSVGSWSFLSSTNKDNQNVTGRNNSSYSIHSSDGTNGVNSPISDINSTTTLTNGYSVLENENNKLVELVAKLQQEKWALEEKTNSILLSMEKLENDLEMKQKIISFYLMERRPSEQIKHQNSNSNDKFTVKKVVDFIKDKESDNLKEINRKLQRIIEELLTKNIHLQNNIELLTNQSKKAADV